jgi:hypothetical protein
VGIIGAWFAAGMWIYLLSLLRREGNGGVDEGARQSEGRWTLGPVNRHTLITELSESGAGDEVIMSIAGHDSRAMLSRLLPRAGWKPNGGHSTTLRRGNARPTRSAKVTPNGRCRLR